MKRKAQLPAKKKSQLHEKDVARKLRGTLQPGSGAFSEKGDVVAGPLLIECKRTDLRAFDLRLSVVEKISREAMEKDLTPGVALRLASVAPSTDQDWVLLPLRIVAELLRRPRLG